MPTIIQSGSFVSAGGNTVLQLRSSVDWIQLFNATTIAAAPANFSGIKWQWFRGMAQRNAFVETYDGAAAYAVTTSAALRAGGNAAEGISLLDSSLQGTGTPVLCVSIAAGGVPPVVTVANTGNLVDGDIVRLTYLTGAWQLSGVDFTVDQVLPLGPTFRLPGMAPIVAAPATGANSRWRKVNYNPLYYPRNRYISIITQAANASVTTTVAHGFTVGQKLRFHIPEISAIAFGMVEMDRVEATVLTVTNAYTFTINVDTTAMNAFAFPLSADVGAGMSFAQVTPIGMDMVTALSTNADYLKDATVNEGYIGCLVPGNPAAVATFYNPGGAAGDTIYWLAGKSENL